MRQYYLCSELPSFIECSFLKQILFYSYTRYRDGYDEASCKTLLEKHCYCDYAWSVFSGFGSRGLLSSVMARVTTIIW